MANLDILNEVAPVFSSQVHGSITSSINDDELYFVIVTAEPEMSFDNWQSTFIDKGSKIKEAFKEYDFDDDSEIMVEVYKLSN
jgi:hypothetical protein